MSSATSENGSVDGGASAVTVCARCRSRLIALRLRTTSDMSVPSTTSDSCSYGAASVAPLLGRLVGDTRPRSPSIPLTTRGLHIEAPLTASGANITTEAISRSIRNVSVLRHRRISPPRAAVTCL